MGFSFSREKRMAANQDHGVARTLSVTATKHGTHQGSESDDREYRALYRRLFNYVPHIVEDLDPNLWPQITQSMDTMFGDGLASNAARGAYPLAIHCAWGAAATLRDDLVVDITKALGKQTLLSSATIFIDRHPGIQKLNPAPDVLMAGGNGLSIPRLAAAVAPTLLGIYALDEGLV